MAKAPIPTPMEKSTSVNGEMATGMAKELKHGALGNTSVNGAMVNVGTVLLMMKHLELC
jgi:hypothetical protein